jgi:hypothetical protein
MATAVREAKQTPPYGPFETYTNLIDLLARTTVPQVIDNSVMGKYSGTARSQLRSTLRFLGQMNDDGTVTDRLHRLVDAWGKPHRPEELARQIGEAYAPILNGLDLRSATLGQLIDRFRTNGDAGGSVLRKAVKFYLVALQAAGVEYSPHFNTRGLSTVAEGGRANAKKRLTPKTQPIVGGGKTSPPPDHRTGHDAAGRARHHAPEGVEEVFAHIPGRQPLLIHVPADLSLAEWDFVNNYIRGYLDLRKKK